MVLFEAFQGYIKAWHMVDTQVLRRPLSVFLFLFNSSLLIQLDYTNIPTSV